MTKRLSRKDLKRQIAKQELGIHTLGQQLVTEQRRRSQAEAELIAAHRNVDKAVESVDKARNELAELRRQLSNARDAQEKLRQALYPGLFASGGKVNPPTGAKLDGIQTTPYGQFVKDVERRAVMQWGSGAGPRLDG